MRYLVASVLACVLMMSALISEARADEGSPAARSAYEAAAPASPDAPDLSRADESPQGHASEPTGSWLARMYPEALEAPTNEPKPGFGIDYAPVEPVQRTKRQRRRAIALGVTIPILAAGIGLGIGAAVAMSNFDLFPEN